MKQTNHALKFLMAQYRAIFKLAYFKGLASTVVMTAGLTIGAATTSSPANADVKDVSALDTATEVKVDGVNNDNVKLSASSNGAWQAALNITNGAAGDGSLDNYIKADLAPATLSGSGSLIINGPEVGLTLLGGDNSKDNTLKVDISTITVTDGSLIVSGSANAGATAIADTVTLGDAAGNKTATLTLQGTGTDKTASFGDSDSNITAYAGSSINLKGDSTLTANTLNLNNSSLATSDNSSGNAINVGQASFTQSNLNVSGALTFKVNQPAAQMADVQAQAYVVFNSSTLNISDASFAIEGGQVTFDAQSTLSVSNGSFTAKNATVDLSAATIAGEDNATITADTGSILKFDSLPGAGDGTGTEEGNGTGTGVKFSAANGGKLQANMLSDLAPIKVGEDSTLSVYNLSLSGTGDEHGNIDATANIDGTLRVNRILQAANAETVTFSKGNLELGYREGDPTDVPLEIFNANLVINNQATLISQTVIYNGSITTNNGSTLSLDDSLILNAGSSLNINSGSSVSFTKDADDNTWKKLVVGNGASLKIGSGSTLSLRDHSLAFGDLYPSADAANPELLLSGTLTVISSATGHAVDLSTANIQGSGTLIAKSAYIVLNKNLDPENNVTFKASGDTVFNAFCLSLSASEIADLSDESTAQFQLDENAQLAASYLEITDESTATINTQGTIIVTDQLIGNDLTFTNGELYFNALYAWDPSVDSVLEANSLTLSNNATTVMGSWEGNGATRINVEDGSSFNLGNVYGNVGSIDFNALALSSGEVTIYQGSDLTAKSLNADPNSSITVYGSMTIEGVTTDDVTAGQAGYLGFAQSGTVAVDSGTFIIGSTAAAGILDTSEAETLQVYDNFGTYALTNKGVLTLLFSKDTSLSTADIDKIKSELISNLDHADFSGFLDIGSATISDLDSIITSGSGESGSTITWDNYQKYIQNNPDLNGTIGDQLANATVQDVSGNFNGNIGAVQLGSTESSLQVYADSILLNADTNGGKFITDDQGEVAGATISAGNLTLKGAGSVGTIKLQGDGSSQVSLTLDTARNDAATAVTVNVNGVDASSNPSTNNGILANTAVNVKQNVTANFQDEVIVDTLALSGSAQFDENATTKDATVNTLKTAEGSTFSANNLTVNREADVQGSLSIDQDLTINSSDSGVDKGTVAGEVMVGHDLEATNVEFSNNIAVSGTFTATDTTVKKTATVTGDLTAHAIEIAEDASIQAANASLIGTNHITGTLATAKSGTVSVGAGTTTVAGSLDTHKLELTDANVELKIVGGSVTTTNLTGFASAVIQVGSDTPATSVAAVLAEDTSGTEGSELAKGAKDGNQTPAETTSNAGSLHIAGSLDLNGATLVIDPAYTDKASIVTVESLAGDKHETDVGLFNGNVFVGQNSALGVGLNSQELTDKLADFMSGDRFVDPNDAENPGQYGAVLYLDKPATIDSQYGIVLTAGTRADLQQHVASTSGAMSQLGRGYAVANTIYFGQGTALAVNIDNYTSGQTYIKFIDSSKGNAEATGSKLIADQGEIVLFGDNYQREYQLFSATVSIEDLNSGSGSITVNSANGLLTGTLTNESKGAVGLTIDQKHLGEFMRDTSAPVQHTIKAYINGYNGEYTSAQDIPAEACLGTYNRKTGKNEYNNAFLSQVILGGSGADVEKVARLGVYGGVAQAALSAGAATYEAVNSRMGIGAQTGSITFADNGQGAGLWVSPIYKNHDSDELGAQGVNYGADLDLYGVALGGDYTLANGLRLGAAFNLGSGDADGQGAGAGVSNDFDYYGFTLYGGYYVGALSLVGDISYTVVDNEVEANTSVEKVSASMDSSNLSLGFTAQYALNLNAVTVTPHAGLRYTNIDMDDYTVQGSSDIAKYAADSANIFSIPVGVTLSKEIAAGNWTVKPAFDVTLTANMGDDSVDGSVTWAGVESLQTTLESEIVDSFTYGATLGISAKTDNLSFGVNINYTGASSANEYGVSANVRLVF